MKRYITIGAIIGLALPLAFWAGYLLTNGRYLFGPETVALWPSAILLMATDGHEGSIASFFIMGLSVILNILLYSVIGAGVYGLTRLARAGKHSA